MNSTHEDHEFPLDHVRLDHEDGSTELFPVERATYNVHREDEDDDGDDTTWLTLHVRAEEATVRLPEDADLVPGVTPWVEISIPVAGDPLEFQTGQVFELPVGYDDGREEHLTNCYYVSHEVIDEVRVTVHGIGDSSLVLTIAGTVESCIAGSASLTGRATFQLDRELDRSFV